MGNAANRAKTKWNAKHYAQIKFSVSLELAAQFRSACAINGASMASALTHFISRCAGSAAKAGVTAAPDCLDTKRKRRKAMGNIIIGLERIRDAQEISNVNTPENLRGSEQYESAECSVAMMDEALEILGDIY